MEPFPTVAKNDLFETEFTPYLDLPGFFPGAGGFFHGCPGPRKRFIFFGTDFGPLSYQQALPHTGGEAESVATIRNLRKIALDAGMHLSDCFLTNAVLCLRRGDSATSNFPIWRNYASYIAACAEWHRRELAQHKPELVVLMGLPHLKYFGQLLFPELGLHWVGLKTMKSVYVSGKEHLCLPDGTNVLLMHHPSFWNSHPTDCKARAVEHLSRLSSKEASGNMI